MPRDIFQQIRLLVISVTARSAATALSAVASLARWATNTLIRLVTSIHYYTQPLPRDIYGECEIAIDCRMGDFRYYFLYMAAESSCAPIVVDSTRNFEIF